MGYRLVATSAHGVSDDLVQTISSLDQVADHNRLNNCAVEFIVSMPFDTSSLGSEAAVDLNFVSDENRLKKLLIADMDSTMIPVECIDELADFAGVKEHVSDITERAMRGELDFDAALKERVSLLKGLPITALEQCYNERISLNPGAQKLVQTMNEMGAITALVSGGFTFFTNLVAKEAGFQINQANTLLSTDKVLTGEVGMPILGQQAKLDAMNAICDRAGILHNDVIAVGDGANDAAIVQAAGIGVSYHGKQALAEIADVRLEHSDLTALLALQGLSQSA